MDISFQVWQSLLSLDVPKCQGISSAWNRCMETVLRQRVSKVYTHIFITDITYPPLLGGSGGMLPQEIFEKWRCVFVHSYLDLGRFADGRICTVFSVY